MKPSLMLSVLMLATLLVAGSAHATAQQPDVLIVDGKDEALYTNPLADWLALHPGALPKSDVTSSGNWRGYVATWEVTNGKLLLRQVDVTVQQGTEKKMRSGVTQDRKGHWVETTPVLEERAVFVRRNVLATLFPNQAEVVADWYTGTLIIPKGEMVNYVHMGYGSTYERYTVIWVRQGAVARRLDLRADQFMELRKARFKAYQQTDEYKKELADSVKQLGAKRAEEFLFEFSSERYLSIDPDAAGD